MRVIKLILAAALIAAPMASSPAVAAAPSAGAVDTEAEVMKLLGDVVAWSTPFNTLMSESSTFGLEMVDIVGEAADPARKGREGRAWMEAWLAKADSELARQKSALAAVPPMPADLERRYRSLGPSGVRQVEGFKTLPTIVQGVIDDTDTLLNRLRPLLIKAASGDEKAKLAVLRHTLSGTRLSLRNENALLDLTIAISNRPDHPQVAVSKSVKSTNAALGLALEYMERQLNEETVDPVATGKAMQAQLAVGRAEAAKIGPNALKLKTEINTKVPAGTFRTNAGLAFDTYQESGQVELRIADTLAAIADRLVSGDAAIDPDGTAFSPIEPLVNQRLALHARRVSYFQSR